MKDSKIKADMIHVFTDGEWKDVHPNTKPSNKTKKDEGSKND